jgi:hypothetical protein
MEDSHIPFTSLHPQMFPGGKEWRDFMTIWLSFHYFSEPWKLARGQESPLGTGETEANSLMK